MANKTVSDIITEVRERVDDENAVRFSSAFIRRAIWEGEREIARRTECLRGQSDLAIAADQQTVYGPTDIVRVHHAQFQPTGQNQVYPLSYRDRRSMDPLWGVNQLISTSAYPEFYTTWDTPPYLEITLAPIPSSAGTLTLFYYRLPAEIARDDTDDNNPLDVPAGWEDKVVDYCMAECALKDRRTDDYQIAMSRFTDGLGAISETAIRFHDDPGQIDYDPMWPGFQGSW